MPDIIKNSQIGNYYLSLLPYVEDMSVSFNSNDNTYSLECDKTYNQNNKIGCFTGYPGKFDSNNKLIIGLANASGLIYVDKTEIYEVLNGKIYKFNHTKYIDEFEDEYKNIDVSNTYIPECTIVQSSINKYSELIIHSCTDENIDEELYGIFIGTPGEYYYDEKINNHNRRYGNEYSTGTIILSGPYNFKYIYNKGQISECVFEKINIFKFKNNC